MTNFHSKNVYFYIHYINSLKVTTLDMIRADIPLKSNKHSRLFNEKDI